MSEDQPGVAPGTETPDLSSEDFDWTQFFAGEGDDDEEAPPASPPAGVAATFVDEDEDDLRKQLAQAQADSKRALEIATQTRSQTTMQTAVNAWKEQATPAELAFSDLLLESKSPEELKTNATFIKKAALTLDSTLQDRVKDVERKMQVEFGLPVSPTFQPMPESERVKELLAANELADAAATMMKGF